MPAAAGAPTMSGALDATPGLFENAVKDLRDSLTCQICLKLLYEPFTTSCGHTYCYECLNQWFAGNGEGLKKTCPDCRSRISKQPAPAYLVRRMVETLCKRNELLPEGETVEEHAEMRRDMVDLVERHKADESKNGGLFEGRFNHPDRPNAIRDVQDGIWRCPDCHAELEDYYCDMCDLAFDDEGAPVRSGSHYDDASDYSGDDYDPMGDRLVDLEAVTAHHPFPPLRDPLAGRTGGFYFGYRPSSQTDSADSVAGVTTDSQDDSDDDDGNVSDLIDDDPTMSDVPSEEASDDDRTINDYSPTPMAETDAGSEAAASDTMQNPSNQSPIPGGSTGNFSSVDGSDATDLDWDVTRHDSFGTTDARPNHRTNIPALYRDRLASNYPVPEQLPRPSAGYRTMRLPSEWPDQEQYRQGHEDEDEDEDEDEEEHPLPEQLPRRSAGYRTMMLPSEWRDQGQYKQGDEDEDEDEEEDEEEDQSGGYNMAGTGPYSDEEDDSESEEDYDDDQSVTEIAPLTRKRSRPVISSGGEDEDTGDNGSSQPRRQRQRIVISSDDDMTDSSHANRSRAANTNASRAPMRGTVATSDDSDSDTPPARTRRATRVAAPNRRRSQASRIVPTSQRKRESSSLAATSRSVASRA